MAEQVQSMSAETPRDPETQLLVSTIVIALEDTKVQDLLVLDVHSAARHLFDTLIICTSTSSRHGAAMAEKVQLALKRVHLSLRGHEGPGEMGWELLDAGAVVVHIMSVEAREYYDLEGLWDMGSTP